MKNIKIENKELKDINEDDVLNLNIESLLKYVINNSNYIGGIGQEVNVFEVIKKLFRKVNMSPVVNLNLYKNMNLKLHKKLNVKSYYDLIKTDSKYHYNMLNFSVMRHPSGKSNSPDIMVKLNDTIYSIEVKTNKTFDLFELGTSYNDPSLFIVWFIERNNEKHYTEMKNLVSPKLRKYFNAKKLFLKTLNFLECAEFGGKMTITPKFSLTSQKLNEVFRGRSKLILES